MITYVGCTDPLGVTIVPATSNETIVQLGNVAGTAFQG